MSAIMRRISPIQNNIIYLFDSCYASRSTITLGHDHYALCASGAGTERFPEVIGENTAKTSGGPDQDFSKTFADLLRQGIKDGKFYTLAEMSAEMTNRVIRGEGPKITTLSHYGRPGWSLLPNPKFIRLRNTPTSLLTPWSHPGWPTAESSEVGPPSEPGPSSQPTPLSQPMMQGKTEMGPDSGEPGDMSAKTDAEVDEEKMDNGGTARGFRFHHHLPMGSPARADVIRVSGRPQNLTATYTVALSDSDPERLRAQADALRHGSAVLHIEAGGLRFDHYEHIGSGTLTFTVDYAIGIELMSNLAISFGHFNRLPLPRGRRDVDDAFFRQLDQLEKELAPAQRNIFQAVAGSVRGIFKRRDSAVGMDDIDRETSATSRPGDQPTRRRNSLASLFEGTGTSRPRRKRTAERLPTVVEDTVAGIFSPVLPNVPHPPGY